MEAGRELDYKVAAAIFGWTGGTVRAEDFGVSEDNPNNAPQLMLAINVAQSLADTVPHYSTSIAAAWLIVEKLHLAVVPVEDEWFAGIFDGQPYAEESYGSGYIDCGLNSGVYASTAPLAICRSALAVVGADPS